MRNLYLKKSDNSTVVKISLDINDELLSVSFPEPMTETGKFNVLHNIAFFCRDGFDKGMKQYMETLTKFSLKIEEELIPAGFDVFWERYGKKINKYRCEPIWKKLTEKERHQAIRQITPYENYLKKTGYQGKRDPENFLKDKYFLSEFESLSKPQK